MINADEALVAVLDYLDKRKVEIETTTAGTEFGYGAKEGRLTLLHQISGFVEDLDIGW